MKKIGLFGGTFNPIHFGHLNLALELMERQNLDEVWFIPALLSPFKASNGIVDVDHRKKMLELALSDFDRFSLCEIELKRPSPSYTIDTILEILSLKEENEEFYLMLSGESFFRFEEWKEAEMILSKVPLLVGCAQETELLKHLSPFIRKISQKCMIKIPMLDISSTRIRERIKKRLYCSHLLPVKVLDYIYQNQLYFDA